MVDGAGWIGIVRRLVKPALYFHILICIYAAVFLFYGRMDPTASAEPVLARQAANLLLAYVPMAWLVSRRVDADPRWLLIPVFFTAGEWLNWMSQALATAMGHPVVQGATFAAPLALDSILLPFYVAAYLACRRPELAIRGASTPPQVREQWAPSSS